jgi:hypothetical protein
LYPELPADQIRILGQSYRIPRAVHAQACGWVEQIAHRMPKTYHPRAIDGTVDHLASLSYRYMDPIGSQLEQWLEEGKTVAFLGSCSYLLDPMKKLLRDWGVPFHNPYRKTRGDWNPLQSKAGTISAAERVLAYQQVAHGSWWTYADLWKWAAALNATQSLFIHGAKTEMRRKADDEGSQPVSVEDLERWMPGDTVAPHAVAGDLTWLQGAPLLDSFVRPMTYACNVVQRRGREALAKKPQVIGAEILRCSFHHVSRRTVAISGSRPYANHTDRFYRESAALRGSPGPAEAFAKPARRTIESSRICSINAPTPINAL